MPNKMTNKEQAITRQKAIYEYRGQIERGTGKPGYKWVNGYSQVSPDGGVLYPLMTRRECQQDAKARGRKAEFKGRLE